MGLHWFSVIEAPGGFLFEWWSVFWDTFIARYKRQAAVESNEASFVVANLILFFTYICCDY